MNNPLMENKAKFITQTKVLLNWYESHPNLPMPQSINFSSYTESAGISEWYSSDDPEEDRQLMIELVKACLLDNIPVKKGYHGDNFSLQFAVDGIKVVYTCQRKAICTATIIGKRVVPAYTYTTAAHEVDEVKWECKDSLLSNAKE